MHRALTGRLSLAANVYSPVRYCLKLACALPWWVHACSMGSKLACVKLLGSVRYES